MKFLTDQDVYAATVRFLVHLGHDVVTVSSLDLVRATDIELLRVARDQGRLFVTRDRIFDGVVDIYRPDTGVILLESLPSAMKAMHANLEWFLTSHSEQELQTFITNIRPDGYGQRTIMRPGS